MTLLLQGAAFQRFFFLPGFNSTTVLGIGSSLNLQPDGITGLIVSLQICKYLSGTFADPSAGPTLLTEVANGWYYANLSTADADTLGPLKYQLTWNAGANSWGDADQVVAFDAANGVSLGLTALPGAVAGAAGGLVLLDGGGYLVSDVQTWRRSAVGSLFSGQVPARVQGVSAGAITDAAFTVPAPAAGPATGVLSMLQQLWRRFFKKLHQDKAGLTIKTFADDNTTVYTTQAYTTSPTDDDVGAAT